MKLFTLLFLLLNGFLMGQDIDKHLEPFGPLLGKTWIAQGEWSNKTSFKQEITFEAGLEGRLIKAHAMGYVDEAQTQWGQRNHGLRKWDAKAGVIKFWEYDVFGEITEGKVTTDGKNIYYTYTYGGENITDAWIWKDDKTYTFKVGNFVDGEWSQVYLETEFLALPTYTGPRKDLDQLLEGMAAFSAAYMRTDHEAIAKFYTENGKIMPGGTKIIEGREAIAERWKVPEGFIVHHHKITPEEVHILGDIAYDYGYYEGSSQPVGKEISNWKGKYVIIWKKIEGQWLMDVDIWNRVND
jgi:ketosteroid isomerase-like protein